MMNVGVIGLGKLGMPMAVAIGNHGHDVRGWDVNPFRRNLERPWPFQEAGCAGRTFEEWRADAQLVTAEPEQIVSWADVIFICVQTPHTSRYEGITRLPPERADFDYQFLLGAVNDLKAVQKRVGGDPIIVVVSTVLPGTLRWLFRCPVVYNPQFLAMGHAVADFLEPEFVLIGTPGGLRCDVLEALYHSLTDAPVLTYDVETAEAIKVLYNTYITGKIVWANTAMELCHKIGADVDDVTDALSIATRRIVSPMYMRGGMGDGGPCHPRDNIALSHLARTVGLSFDWFEALMVARERQAEYLCRLVADACREHDLTPVILGTAYKAGTDLTIGSASLLCAEILEEWGHTVHCRDEIPRRPHVFLIGTRNPEWGHAVYPTGSVIIDPWRMVADRKGVFVVRVGSS